MTLDSSLLSAIPGLRHAFFTREGGVSEGIYAGLNGGLGSNDDPQNVAENRRRMATQMGVAPDRLLSVHQLHSPDAVVANGPWEGASRPRADAIVTRTEGLAISITAADCGPVLLVDPNARVIGAAHAGWKGAVAGVLENTLAVMERLGAKTGRIAAAIGPTISQTNYEVGADLQAHFDSADDRFFVPSNRPGYFRFDLPGYVAQRLTQAGVGSVSDLGLCTYPLENSFFSYRRTTHLSEPDYGREISAITILG
jgi:hypothetical protein